MTRRLKIYKLTLLSILVFIVAGCDGDHSPVAPASPLYPTTIAPLPADSLTALTSDFQRRHPRVCSDLDEYGHPVRRSGNSALSCPPSVGIDVGASHDELVEATKAAMADMFDFSGVSDASTLVTRRTSVFGGSPFANSFLTVTFENQRYEGREVLSTRITAWVDSLGVLAVRGHHFAEIYMPAIRFPAVAAQARIVGLEIPWRDVLGREHVFVVTRDSFEGDPAQVIRPQKDGDLIELRVAWAFGVEMYDFPSWYVYVDIVTGELLGTRQLFST
jgi:hypothetical protein